MGPFRNSNLLADVKPNGHFTIPVFQSSKTQTSNHTQNKPRPVPSCQFHAWDNPIDQVVAIMQTSSNLSNASAHINTKRSCVLDAVPHPWRTKSVLSTSGGISLGPTPSKLLSCWSSSSTSSSSKRRILQQSVADVSPRDPWRRLLASASITRSWLSANTSRDGLRLRGGRYDTTTTSGSESGKWCDRRRCEVGNYSNGRVVRTRQVEIRKWFD